MKYSAIVYASYYETMKTLVKEDGDHLVSDNKDEVIERTWQLAHEFPEATYYVVEFDESNFNVIQVIKSNT